MPLDLERPQGDASGAAPADADYQQDVQGPARRTRWLAIASLVALILLAPILLRVLWGDREAPSSSQPATHAQALLHVSAELFVNGRYEESILVSKEVLAIDPSSAEAHNNMAVAYVKLARWDEALASVQQALRIEPDMVLARNNLGWIEAERAAAAGAAPTGEQERPTGEAEGAARFVALSAQYYRDGRWQDSINAGKAALGLDAGSAEAHNNISAACAQLGLWDAAAQHAREALRLSPGFELAAGNLAAAEAALGAAGAARKKRGASK